MKNTLITLTAVLAIIGWTAAANAVVSAGDAKEGSLYFLHADNLLTGDYKRTPYLLLDNGQAYLLDSDIDLAGVAKGERILVDGAKNVQKLPVKENGTQQFGARSTELSADGKFPVLRPGLQIKVAAIFVKQTSDPADPASDDPDLWWYTEHYVNNRLFGSGLNARDYFLESSTNRLRLTGSTTSNLSAADLYSNNDVGYTMLSSIDPCDAAGVAAEAVTLAAVDGFVLADYDQVIVIKPPTDCSSTGTTWSGYAGLLGSKAVVMNYAPNLRQLIHELGHNFGLSHADGFVCDDGGAAVALSDHCSSVGYGDPFDPMGSADHFYYDMTKRATLSSFVPEDYQQTITESGVYELVPMAYPSYSNTKRQLVIGSPVRINGQNYSVSLEYRYPYGFDDFSATEPVAKSILIRASHYSSATNATYLINTHPALSMEDGAPLKVGETFEGLGMTVEVISANHKKALVYIEPVTKCLASQYSVSLSGSGGSVPGMPMMFGVPQVSTYAGIAKEVEVTINSLADNTCYVDFSSGTTKPSWNGSGWRSDSSRIYVDPFGSATNTLFLNARFGVSSTVFDVVPFIFSVDGTPLHSFQWVVQPGFHPCGGLESLPDVLPQKTVAFGGTQTWTWTVANGGPNACTLDIQAVVGMMYNDAPLPEFIAGYFWGTFNGGDLNPVIAAGASLNIPMSVSPPATHPNQAVYLRSFEFRPLPDYPTHTVMPYVTLPASGVGIGDPD